MKRSELKVGDELYWAKPYDWKHDHTGKKVTVLHVEPYGRAEYGRREIRPERDGKGSGVHVEVNGFGVRDWKDVVRLGDLRGPWETTRDAVEARVEAKRQHENDERVRRNAERQTRTAIVDRAKATGYGFALVAGDRMEGRVMTTVETLGLMLDRIETLTANVSRLDDEITDLRCELSGTENMLNQERMGGYGDRS